MFSLFITLAEQFSLYFSSKLEMLPKRLPQTDNSGLPESVLCTSTFPNFDDVSEDLVSRMICKSASKSCALDPIPTTLLKDSLGVLLPTITHLINLSLKQGVYPDLFKKALIRPALKKPNLDPEEFSNYRPVANLSFLSKTLERIVATQLNDYLEHNNLLPKMQSAYRPRHSTETAILRVFNDIQRSIDNRLEVVLVLLDLSSAFDTLDHEILIDRLQHRYGIDDIALRWFNFYLSGRSQAVMINNITSDVRQLPYGVPQGSVLGPVLFSLYFAPLEVFIRAHGLGLMLYADDTQLYISLNPNNKDNRLSSLECCLQDKWLYRNKLVCNQGKTEILHLTSRYIIN